MDRLKLITSLFLIFLVTPIYCIDIPLSFPRTEEMLGGIEIEKMFQGQKDNASSSEWEYFVDKRGKIGAFLKMLNKYETDSSMLGYWILQDANGKELKKRDYDLDSTFIFTDEDNYTNTITGANGCFLYIDDNGNFYIMSRWICLIRQLKFIDDKLYFYTLDGDYWILDSMHSGGKYFYKKKK